MYGSYQRSFKYMNRLPVNWRGGKQRESREEMARTFTLDMDRWKKEKIVMADVYT